MTASLVAFPSVLPWMIAGWLMAFTVCVARGQSGWLPLVAVLAIVLVKRVYLYPTLIALAIAMAAVIAFDAWSRRPQRRERRARWRWGSVIALWLGWLAVLWQGEHASRRGTIIALHPDRPIICLGDSLTSGIAPDGGYSQELQQLLSVPVLDLGEAGITIAQAQRMVANVAHTRPQAVVIELGGHDFLKGADRAATKAKLLELIGQVRSLGAEPVLVEIPRGFMTDPYAGLERELAHQEDLELVSDSSIRKLVIWSPFAPPGMWMRSGHLSSDGLHPNAAGNRELARAVADALAGVYGPSIRRPDARGSASHTPAGR